MVQNLKDLRKRSGLSQKVLGELLGLTQQTINSYENHKTEPDIYVLCQMADFFGTSVDYLIGHTDIPRKYEVLRPYDLSPEEAALIDQYRQLDSDQRESLRLIAANYLK